MYNKENKLNKKGKVWWIAPVEVFLLLVAISTMAITMYVTQDGDILGPMSLSFIGIFSIYLGVDLGRMLKETSDRPDGEYKDMKFGRYVFSLLSFFSLLVWAYIVSKNTNTPMTASIATFGSGSLIFIGYIVGGIEANKLFTGRKE